MLIEVIITAGEDSETARIAEWYISNNSIVTEDQELALIESENINYTLISPASGKIAILIKEDVFVNTGSVVAIIDTNYKTENKENELAKKKETVFN